MVTGKWPSNWSRERQCPLRPSKVRPSTSATFVALPPSALSRLRCRYCVLVVVVVVELPQSPEDYPQKRWNCEWKADESITLRACGLFVMVIEGWVGAGMEVVVGRLAGQLQDGWSHGGRCRSTSRV